MTASKVRFDPHLEESGLWHEFHVQFIVALQNHLSAALQPRYFTYIDERTYVASGDSASTYYIPDLNVTRADTARETTTFYNAETPVEPVVPVRGTIAVPWEIKEPRLEVRTADDDERLVTAVELLSPTNKRPGHKGRDAYLKKRDELLAARVHLVELDLLVKGERMPITSPWPPGDRMILVARSTHVGHVDIYPVAVDAPLPAIRFPLLKPDPDYALDLQPLFADIWHKGRFEARLIRRMRSTQRQADLTP